MKKYTYQYWYAYFQRAGFAAHESRSKAIDAVARRL
mgnify:CR=1 FL=1